MVVANGFLTSLSAVQLDRPGRAVRGTKAHTLSALFVALQATLDCCFIDRPSTDCQHFVNDPAQTASKARAGHTGVACTPACCHQLPSARWQQ